jgi:NTP pyrophosphatase (non-canonical NTP hydrolase)
MTTCSKRQADVLKEETMAALLAFRREREWEQFHSPKNLAIGIAVEAGELLEQFQWTTADQGPRDAVHGDRRVREEIADVAILLTYIALDLGVDIDLAVKEKLAINERRYPVGLSRGTATKHDER